MHASERNGIKVENIEAFVQSRVVLGFPPFHVVIRSSGALTLLECSLICEVNWHVFIRHHVIKSNLRHPHISPSFTENDD